MCFCYEIFCFGKIKRKYDLRSTILDLRFLKIAEQKKYFQMKLFKMNAEGFLPAANVNSGLFECGAKVNKV